MMVNSFADERKEIELRFTNSFDTMLVPTRFDNIEFLKAGDGIFLDENTLNNWVRLSIMNVDAQQLEVGNTTTRVTGTIIINIFVKENTGSNHAREIADKILPIFK
jgi:hypothetical protein